jgi:ferredoxin
MKTTILYFSATGNSYCIARTLSDHIGECQVKSISHLLNRKPYIVSTPVVGFIFPVYAWGMPRIVEEFISNLQFEGKPYIFTITSCVAIPGNTLNDVGELLQKQGQKLSAGFTISAGRSSLMQLNTLDKIIIRLDRKRKKIRNIEMRLPEIIRVVSKQAMHKPESSSYFANLFGSIFHKLAIKSFISADSSFIIRDTCTNCGRCANICPRSNIIIKEGKPDFGHNCELCHACIQWCPTFSIKHPNFDTSLKQYHNPSVKYQDMFAETLSTSNES